MHESGTLQNICLICFQNLHTVFIDHFAEIASLSFRSVINCNDWFLNPLLWQCQALATNVNAVAETVRLVAPAKREHPIET